MRTNGDSWTLQKEGERTVIVIEDTPPPSTSAKAALPPPIPVPTPSFSSVAPKRAKYSATNTAASGVAGYANYTPATTTAYNTFPQAGPSNYAQAPSNGYPPANGATTRKVSGAKRKYNEVNDPATAVSY